MSIKKSDNFRSLKLKLAVNDTTAEDCFINQCIRTLTPVELKLTNGEIYSAVITAHDKNSIIIKECLGCQTLIYKNDLSHISTQLSKDFVYAKDADDTHDGHDGQFLKRRSKYAPYYS